MAVQTNRQINRACLVVLTLSCVAAQPALAAEAVPDIDADSVATFVLQRGLYARCALGTFLTLGGQYGHSAPQPYMAIAAGYDLSDIFSVQLEWAAGFVGNNPISASNAPTHGRQGVASYGLTMAGVQVLLALRPWTRLAIEPRLGIGLAWLSTPLLNAAGTQSLGSQALHILAGLDINYLTLLTDFSAGLSLTSYTIPALAAVGVSAAGVVRYTF